MSGRILIIDDDVDFRDSVAVALEAHGFTVQTAANGKEGREAMAAGRPDLIVLDVMMSWALEGLRMSLELKRTAETRFIPIVMVSSIGASEYSSAFPADQPLHVDEFISKPVEPEHLVRRVKKLLAERVGV
jgi:DNA-binding response OmpR family regulator